MHPTSPDRLEPVIRLLAGAGSVGLVSHRRPDGDAIGSCLALGGALEAAGKRVRIVNEDPVPEALAFLRGSERVELASGIGEPIGVEVVVALDAAGEDRVGDGAWAAFRTGVPVINLDHHISNTRFGSVNYVDAASPATGQIVFELIREAGWPLPQAAAEAIYAALSTDTGSFRYPSTTGRTYRIAAELVDAGLDVGEMNRRLYENYPLRRLLLLRGLLQDMEIHAGGKVVAAKLTRRMAEEAGMETGDTEGLIDVIRSVDSVVVAVLFEELPDGRIRVSSRSKSPLADVGAVCAVFGGGGHILAAGARMAGPIDAAAERFLNEVSRRLDGLD